MTKDDEFQLVVRSKGRRNRNKLSNLPNISSISLADTCDSSYSIEKITESINANIQIIKESNLYQQITQNLKVEPAKRVKLICFGLGSFNSYISRYQFALGKQLQSDLGADSWYFDPLFTSQDVEVLKQFNCNLLLENLEGKYEAADGKDYVTIFYLPHCAKQLTNNLLWKNWDKEKLSSIFILSNSFLSIIERSIKSVIQHSAALVEKIYPFTTETLLQEFEPAFEAFNDLSLHRFDQLGKIVDPNFWVTLPEPVYQIEDLEFTGTVSKAELANVKDGQ